MTKHLNSTIAVACLALIALTLVLTGCGGGSTATTSAGAAGKTDAAAAGNDTLAKIKKEGVIKWGADAEGGAPFVFRDAKDTEKIIGFEMDLMDTFAKHLGVKHERVQGEWASLIDNMKSKRTDMVVNGYEINDERKKVVGFSEPYYLYEQQLTVRAEDKDKIKSLTELKGRKIGTLDGAEANNVLLKAGFAEDLLAKHPDSLTPYSDLEIKRVDAVLQESIIAAYYAGKNSKLYNIPQTFSPGKYAIAVRLEDVSLLKEVDRILGEMKKNGELATIYKKWEIMTDKQKEIGIQEK
jgi:polar amino acid transport system substrate-binding protein